VARAVIGPTTSMGLNFHASFSVSKFAGVI